MIRTNEASAKSFKMPPRLGEAESSRKFDRVDGRPKPRRPLFAVKDLFLLVYLYPFRLVAALVPTRWVLMLSRLVDPVCQRLTFSRKRAIRRHIEAAKRFHSIEQDLDRLTADLVTHDVRRATDDMILHKLAARGLLCTKISGLEYLADALAKGNGAIVLSGHFYANRVARRHLEQLGYPTLSVRNGRPPEASMGRIGRRFLHHRYIDYLHGVIRDEVLIHDPECTLKIFKRLRAGGIVHIYLDAGVTELRSTDEAKKPVWLPFLGTMRPFPAGFMQIVRLSGCALIPMLCLGHSQGFDITFDKPVDLVRDAGAKEFVSDNFPRLVADLESKILKHAEQWEFWGIFEHATELP